MWKKHQDRSFITPYFRSIVYLFQRARWKGLSFLVVCLMRAGLLFVNCLRKQYKYFSGVML